jgi:hypothetical protein
MYSLRGLRQACLDGRTDNGSPLTVKVSQGLAALRRPLLQTLARDVPFKCRRIARYKSIRRTRLRLPIRELDANDILFAEELLLDGLTPAGDLGISPLTLYLHCCTTTLFGQLLDAWDVILKLPRGNKVRQRVPARRPLAVRSVLRQPAVEGLQEYLLALGGQCQGFLLVDLSGSMGRTVTV